MTKTTTKTQTQTQTQTQIQTQTQTQELKSNILMPRLKIRSFVVASECCLQRKRFECKVFVYWI
jgi:hypothetical protein